MPRMGVWRGNSCCSEGGPAPVGLVCQASEPFFLHRGCAGWAGCIFRVVLDPHSELSRSPRCFRTPNVVGWQHLAVVHHFARLVLAAGAGWNTAVIGRVERAMRPHFRWHSKLPSQPAIRTLRSRACPHTRNLNRALRPGTSLAGWLRHERLCRRWSVPCSKGRAGLSCCLLASTRGRGSAHLLRTERSGLS